MVCGGWVGGLSAVPVLLKWADKGKEQRGNETQRELSVPPRSDLGASAAAPGGRWPGGGWAGLPAHGALFLVPGEHPPSETCWVVRLPCSIKAYSKRVPGPLLQEAQNGSLVRPWARALLDCRLGWPPLLWVLNIQCLVYFTNLTSSHRLRLRHRISTAPQWEF